MSAWKLLVLIAERGYGNHLVGVARNAGAGGGTVVPGRGTASSTLLQVLGLGGAERDVVLIVAAAALSLDLLAAMHADPLVRRKVRGLAFIVDVEEVLSHFSGTLPLSEPVIASGAGADAMPHTHVLISVIVNVGYAGDIMHAARNAGATGGTLLEARGTAREGDEKFFGVPLVPEKEVLMILARREEAQNILTAIRSCPCLEQPGMGMAFCVPVAYMTALGRQAGA